MLNLETLFKNHFASKEVSDDELKKFADDHLQRLTAGNTDGILDPILADTGAKYIAYFGAISDEDVATAVRQALTANVDAIIAEFKALVSRREGAVRDAFGRKGADYQMFFPQGLSEYSNATKENVETLMLRLESASAAKAASLPSGFKAQWTDILSRYRTARTAQLGKKGDVATGKESSAGARTALELQVTGNIHFIGWKWPGNVEKAMSFFDQSIIHDQHRGGGRENAPGVDGDV